MEKFNNDKNMKKSNNNPKKKYNICKLLTNSQINYQLSINKNLQNRINEKLDEESKINLSSLCVEDHTFKYYPFVNNGLCRFCMKPKKKTDYEIYKGILKELN